MAKGMLITCGIVCSGVASRKAWGSFVNALESRYGKLAGYQHRPKSFGERRGCTLPEAAILADGTVKQGTLLTKTWKKAYGGRWDLRPTCHQCPFHSAERVEDVTIGDFWGLNERSSFWDPEGTSLVMFNNASEATEWAREQLLERAEYAAFPLEYAANDRQPRLSSSSAPNAVRPSFLKEVSSRGWMSGVFQGVSRAVLNKTSGHGKPATIDSIVGAPCVGGVALENRLVRDKQDCYGCGACAQACSRDAITMTEDEEGFLYPAISSKTCIDCGQCNAVCPRANHEFLVPQKAAGCYALKLRDRAHYDLSSSGGAFWGLAEAVLAAGGVVYGVAFSPQLESVTIRCDNVKQCESCMGSKYAQSDTGDSFSEVKEDLADGKTVLFSGTPCQVAGLRRYLEAMQS